MDKVIHDLTMLYLNRVYTNATPSAEAIAERYLKTYSAIEKKIKESGSVEAPTLT